MLLFLSQVDWSWCLMFTFILTKQKQRHTHTQHGLREMQGNPRQSHVHVMWIHIRYWSLLWCHTVDLGSLLPTQTDNIPESGCVKTIKNVWFSYRNDNCSISLVSPTLRNPQHQWMLFIGKRPAVTALGTPEPYLFETFWPMSASSDIDGLVYPWLVYLQWSFYSLGWVDFQVLVVFHPQTMKHNDPELEFSIMFLIFFLSSAFRN